MGRPFTAQRIFPLFLSLVHGIEKTIPECSKGSEVAELFTTLAAIAGLQDSEDQLVWKGQSNGSFKVKSCNSLLLDNSN